MGWNKNQTWFAKVRDKKKVILKQNPNIDDSSGIYIIWRYDPELAKGVIYVGQSLHCLERLAKHLLGYQAIDNSIRKHKIYDRYENPNGYKFATREHCSKELLDEREKYWIEEYQKDGWILKNITGGGQIDKATDINERKASKGYHDGLKQGYKNCLRDVKEFFDKYLDFVIKEPRLTKTKKPVAIKQKKYEEFKKLIEGATEDDTSN